MNKLHLTKVNPGNYTKEKPFYEKIKTFNNGIAEVSDFLITIKSKDGKTFKSKLHKTEKDVFSETFHGSFEDGTSFRIVKPSGFAKEMMALQGKGESITFASMSGDGYAVHFVLVNINEADIKDFEENRNTEFTSATESKAEMLVMTADSLQHLNTETAKEHIGRFMNLLEQNEIEILKFEHIQNIIYGYVLAIRLSVIDEDMADEKINKLRLRFHSRDHLRYERGMHVSGPHGRAGRGIEVIPNFNMKEGYLVTIYNQDDIHPVWGNNIQMAPKQMKVINKTENEIQLRGFGTDPMGNSFSDYALSICLTDNGIDFIKLHMLDRGIDIKYIK